MIKVYRMNDYDWVATNLSKLDTNEWYKKEMDFDNEEQSLGTIVECNLVDDGLTIPIEELSQEDLNIHKIFKKYGNNVYAWFSFDEILAENDENTIYPYIIASTEY